MVYSDEGAPSSLDNHRLFFLLQRRTQSFSLAHYTYSKGSHTPLFICWGGQGPKVKGKLLGTQRLSPRNWEYVIPFQIPEAKAWDKAGDVQFTAPPLGRGLMVL